LREKSLNDQLDELIRLGNKSGLHDAADWLRAQVDSARLIFNIERERQEQQMYLNRFVGEGYTLPVLRDRLKATFPDLSTPKAHAIVSRWLREHGRPNTVEGALVS
jgi:hypothetical protein